MKRSAVLKYPLRMRIGMGLDGGGTKTDCILMDDAGNILGRGRGGPSNPSRIGVDTAARGVKEAANAALLDAAVTKDQVTDVCAGLAGVALAERARAMETQLRSFFASARFELCTDLDLALSAAGAVPAIVLVAGTGSAAIGRNASGKVARSGGFGPKKSDEGSAFSIGKNAVNELLRAADGDAQELRTRILDGLGGKSLEAMLGLDGAEADAVYPKLFPIIANAADEGNEIAKNLLREAAESLTGFVADVQAELELGETRFVLGKTGGMIGRSIYFDAALDADLRGASPAAQLKILNTPLAEVAARRSLSL